MLFHYFWWWHHSDVILRNLSLMCKMEITEKLKKFKLLCAFLINLISWLLFRNKKNYVLQESGHNSVCSFKNSWYCMHVLLEFEFIMLKSIAWISISPLPPCGNLLCWWTHLSSIFSLIFLHFYLEILNWLCWNQLLGFQPFPLPSRGNLLWWWTHLSSLFLWFSSIFIWECLNLGGNSNQMGALDVDFSVGV